MDKEPDGQGAFFLLFRYDPTKKRTKPSPSIAEASTAYVPDGRPSIFAYLFTYSVLIKIRSNERVGMRLAVLMTAFVPVSGWQVPKSSSRPEHNDVVSDRMWLVFCVSCVVLLLAGCTANERRISHVGSGLHQALLGPRQLVMVICGTFPLVNWLHGRLLRWPSTTPFYQRNKWTSQAARCRKASSERHPLKLRFARVDGLGLTHAALRSAVVGGGAGRL